MRFWWQSLSVYSSCSYQSLIYPESCCKINHKDLVGRECCPQPLSVLSEQKLMFSVHRIILGNFDTKGSREFNFLCLSFSRLSLGRFQIHQIMNNPHYFSSIGWLNGQVAGQRLPKFSGSNDFLFKGINPKMKTSKEDITRPEISVNFWRQKASVDVVTDEVEPSQK